MHSIEQAHQDLQQEPSLLDWYSLQPDDESDISSGDIASAVGMYVVSKTLREGFDVEIPSVDVYIKGDRIHGIRRGDVQGFRELETYLLEKSDNS